MKRIICVLLVIAIVISVAIVAKNHYNYVEQRDEAVSSLAKVLHWMGESALQHSEWLHNKAYASATDAYWTYKDVGLVSRPGGNTVEIFQIHVPYKYMALENVVPTGVATVDTAHQDSCRFWIASATHKQLVLCGLEEEYHVLLFAIVDTTQIKMYRHVIAMNRTWLTGREFRRLNDRVSKGELTKFGGYYLEPYK